MLAVGVALFFGSGGFTSKALRIDEPPPSSSHLAVKTPVVIGRVTLARAASNAAVELVGSGDSSLIGWFPYYALWGRRDVAPAGSVGWHSPSWWQSALDLRALIRYLEATHNTQPVYQQVIDRTFAVNVSLPHSNEPRNFGNEFMDDTLWWGLAWLEAARYELNVRHDSADATKFFNVAAWDANYAWSSPRPCGTQGLAWEVGYPSDTITNDEFIALVGELAQSQNRPGPWFDPGAVSKWEREGWQQLWWLKHTRLINVNTGHVYDTFNSKCRASGGALTYTEGETGDALLQMGLATGQHEYIVEARRFLSYALSRVTGMTYGGVLQEPCEALPGRCHGTQRVADAAVWKGIFVDAVADYRAATGSREFDAFLVRQARAVIGNAASDGKQPTTCQTPHSCQLGFYWSRRVPADQSSLPPGAGTQDSGLSALSDALPLASG